MLQVILFSLVSLWLIEKLWRPRIGIANENFYSHVLLWVGRDKRKSIYLFTYKRKQ